MTGRTVRATSDVIVIGGGPAGCATAITAQRAGARVVMLEREADARDRPGETLHPGIEPLLDWLGAGDLLDSATLARHEGHWVQAFGDRQYMPFGSDANGAWRGYQVWRRTLDGGLQQRASDLGVEVRLGAAAWRVLRDRFGRVRGVATKDGSIAKAETLIDASGGRHWLARLLRLGVTQLSPRYVANFGYVSPDQRGERREHGDLPAAPLLRADRDGWTWIAPLGARGWHWTRLSFAGKRMSPGWRPPELERLATTSRSRGADVTWRMAQTVAGPGWMIVGDAAAVLDPAASHGVLRALTSGVRAGLAAAASCRAPERAPVAFAEFDAWFRAGVLRDVEALRTCYRDWSRAAARSA